MSGRSSNPKVAPEVTQRPRGWLRSSAGVFVLSDSDRHCGSYFSLRDAAKIFGVDVGALRGLRSIMVGDRVYLSDQTLGRAWADGTIRSPLGGPLRGNVRISFDELVILAIMRLALPDAEISTQVRVGNRTADFQIDHGAKRIFVEFYGPYHFIRRERTQRLVDPRVRAMQLELVGHAECVIWPYWIQRSVCNARALLDNTVPGLGALWSTSALFGNFAFSDSASAIVSLTERFNAIRDGGVGYMYTDKYARKPHHPVIARIRQGREDIIRLIPPGAQEGKMFWLPESLWPHVTEKRRDG